MKNIDLTNDKQKIFAGILLGGVILLLYFLLPPFIVFLQNLWLAAILFIPIIYIIMNPFTIWTLFKSLSWYLTKSLISKNKLGYMYGYYDYLVKKIANLNDNIKNISGVKVKIERKIGEIKMAIEDSKKRIVEYEQRKQPETVLRPLRNKLIVDTKQLEVLLPRYINIESQEKYLKKLEEAWAADIQDLKYTLDSKTEEYELMKEVAEATDNAAEFLKGNSEELKVFNESLKQIEDKVTQYTANIEDFGNKIKPVLLEYDVKQDIKNDEALKLIEEYRKNQVSLKFDTQ